MKSHSILKKIFYAVLLFLILFPAQYKAQELGVIADKIWTDNYEMGNPVGIGFYYMQPIGRFGIRVEYIYAGHSRHYTGQLSYGFMLYPPEYADENIKSEASYSSAAVGLYINKFVTLAGIDFNFGAGISIDKFECKRTATVTGRQSTISPDKKYGYYFAASFSKEYIFKIPLKVELQYRLKAIESSVYTTDIEQPFIGINGVKEVSVAVAYLF